MPSSMCRASVADPGGRFSHIERDQRWRADKRMSEYALFSARRAGRIVN
ncbi:hypothetical protein [Variovorax paradoxus]|uniref:Uncharacterized protein n=1 Tax=Variovorax paradoxus TaxID=34073 RepID=A0A6I6HMG9_VARPD|nr:hypothetical protein [Variovorax paradoxus]QGW84025.1 hypothetical protein GOQ09_21690 [Variovorax paradoxus]